MYRCEIPCPRDCQVGQWSTWGPCKPSKCPSDLENDSQEGKHTYFFHCL